MIREVPGGRTCARAHVPNHGHARTKGRLRVDAPVRSGWCAVMTPGSNESAALRSPYQGVLPLAEGGRTVSSLRLAATGGARCELGHLTERSTTVLAKLEHVAWVATVSVGRSRRPPLWRAAGSPRRVPLARSEDARRGGGIARRHGRVGAITADGAAAGTRATNARARRRATRAAHRSYRTNKVQKLLLF